VVRFSPSVSFQLVRVGRKLGRLGEFLAFSRCFQSRHDGLLSDILGWIVAGQGKARSVHAVVAAAAVATAAAASFVANRAIAVRWFSTERRLQWQPTGNTEKMTTDAARPPSRIVSLFRKQCPSLLLTAARTVVKSLVLGGIVSVAMRETAKPATRTTMLSLLPTKN